MQTCAEPPPVTFTVVQVSWPGQARVSHRGRQSTGTAGAGLPIGMVSAGKLVLAGGPGSWQFGDPCAGATTSTTARLPCE